MSVSKKPTPNVVRETLDQIREEWQAGRRPDFHIHDNTGFRPGDRIAVISGQYRGRRGRIAMTHDTGPRIVAKLLALHAGIVRVALDHDTTEGGWSGVIPVSDLSHVRLETDAELYARMEQAYGALGDALARAKQCSGEELDEVAKGLKFERRELPISEPHDPPAGLLER